MKKIQYTIGGINYVMIQVPISDSVTGTRCINMCKKYECIVQETSIKDRGLFYKRHIVLKILVPEKNLIKFNAENLL